MGRLMGLDAAWAARWMTDSAAVVAQHRMELIDLDRAIGDGDHGENLHRGFTAVVAKLADAKPQSPADVFTLVATTLMSTVGGAAGPLYGTAFLRAAKACAAAELDAGQVADAIEAAGQGVIARGKAEAGDKTMVDAWLPAARAARDAADDGADPGAVLQAAADAAAQGAADTEPWVARKGRASYLGGRARGHRDPGAQSTALLLAAAAQAATEAGDG